MSPCISYEAGNRQSIVYCVYVSTFLWTLHISSIKLKHLKANSYFARARTRVPAPACPRPRAGAGENQNQIDMENSIVECPRAGAGAGAGARAGEKCIARARARAKYESALKPLKLIQTVLIRDKISFLYYTST